MIEKWKTQVLTRLYQTSGINNAIADDNKFAKTIMSCLGKYISMNLGDTCVSDCKANNDAVILGSDRIVAKY